MTNLIAAQDISDFAPDLDTSSFSATTLSGIISRASQQVVAFCNVKDFALGTYTDTDRARISNEGELIINTRVRPIQSVQSITLEKGGFSTSLVLSQGSTLLYQIPDPANRIHFPNSYLYASGSFLAGGSSQLVSLKYANVFCTTTYTAGYQTIPDDLKDACSLWAIDIIMRRANRAGVQSFSQGSLSMNFGRNAKDGDSSNVKEAKSILLQGDYVKVGGF